MVGKKLILFLFFIFGIGLSSFGQTYSYTYVDPCTGIPNTIQLSSASGSVTMFYGGQYRTFTFAELQQGSYDTWVANINAQAPVGSNPCAGNAGPVTNNFNNILANSMTGNITNITNIVSMASSLGTSMSGAASTAGGVSSSTSSNSDSDNNNSSTNNSTNNSGGSNSGGSGNNGGSNSGGSGSNGGGSTGGSGNSGGGGSGGQTSGGTNQPTQGGSQGQSQGQNAPDGSQPEQGGALGEMNATSASGGSTESSGGGKKSNSERISRGALIGAADLVIIRNDSLITKSGNDNLKINSSITHVNTKQTVIKGVNVNYQTGVNILNLTLYGSYKKKNYMLIGSNSSMYNFKRDWFNTTSVLASQKVSKVTLMAGTNYTFGQMGKGDFGNWSIIGGGFTNFKGNRSFGANVMLLGVYSPYIFYYDGQWYKSGILFIPLINTDFKLTDKFKWSISFAGTYQLNSNVLNYQIATGTKLLL